MDKILKDYFIDLSEKNAKKALDYFIMNKIYPYEIQYANEKLYRWIVKYCYEICKIISKEHPDKIFLDFGCGIGAIEYFNDLFFDCNIDSCDWIDRDQIYNKMQLKEPKFNCSDWLSNDFKIFNCNIKYDAIIIMRSILLHQLPEDNTLPNTFENFIRLLEKILPYLNEKGEIILLQPRENFITEIKDFLVSNNTKFFNKKIPGDGDVYSLKPSSIETFISKV